MDEEPPAGVHEHAVGVALEEVARASGEVGHSHLAGREQVDARNGLVADGDLALQRVDVEARKSVEVGEDRAVGRADCEFELGHLGEDTEKAGLVLGHEHLASEGLGPVGDHFINY